jgi:histidyl-tRNA synthetase
MNISYIVNPRIVRGLDYYTKTVFEFISNRWASGYVIGGGSIRRFVEALGGSATPRALDSSGIERMLLIMEAEQIEIPKSEPRPSLSLLRMKAPEKRRRTLVLQPAAARRICRA